MGLGLSTTRITLIPPLVLLQDAVGLERHPYDNSGPHLASCYNGALIGGQYNPETQNLYTKQPYHREILDLGCFGVLGLRGQDQGAQENRKSLNIVPLQEITGKTEVLEADHPDGYPFNPCPAKL